VKRSLRKKERKIIFLSYSSLDFDTFQILRVAKQLEKYPEVKKVFYWEKDSEQNIVEYMERNLNLSNIFGVFCSKNAKKSKSVKGEWETAYQLSKKKPLKIVPVYEDEEYVPSLLLPMLTVKFLKGNINGFIEKLRERINHIKSFDYEDSLNINLLNSTMEGFTTSFADITKRTMLYEKLRAYKIVPQLRDGCVIQDREEELINYDVGDTVYLISNLPTKKYSIVSKIEALENAEEPKIFVKKSNLGKFGENDEIYILKYNPAEALEIDISISNEYALITKGDWTPNIKPSVIGKLIDIGNEISFMISWEGGDPIVGTGIVNSCLPSPPVYVGESTRIYIEKKSLEEISKLKREKIQNHVDRVDILEKEIEQKTIQLIRTIKQKNYPNKGQKYNFKAINPEHLFNAVLGIFKGLDIIEEPIEKFFDDKTQDYLASAVFLTEQNTKSYQIIDVQVSATENSGILVIWVTGENETNISNILKKYSSRISQLKQGLEPKVEIFSTQCPECAADLPIKNIDVNGLIECIHCNKISKIPKILRY